MAENESLDLRFSHRIRVVFDAALRQESDFDVVFKFEKALVDGLRNATKQFSKVAISPGDFVAARDQPEVLREMLRKLDGHVYAQLLVDVLLAEVASPREYFGRWLDAILDRTADQLTHGLAGSRFQTLDAAHAYVQEVRDRVVPRLGHIPSRLAINPAWRPTRAPRRLSPPSNPTANLLPHSLLPRIP